MSRAYSATSFEEEKSIPLYKLQLLLTSEQSTMDRYEFWSLEEELVSQFFRASNEICNDHEVMLIAVAACSRLVNFCSEALRSDSEVMLRAASKDCSALASACESLQGNKDFLKALMRENGFCLSVANVEAQRSPEVVLEAVKSTGLALRYASESLRGQKDFILEAVRCQGNALEFAALELQADREVVLAALGNCPTAIKFASQSLTADLEVVTSALLRGGRTDEVLHFCSDDLKCDQDLVLLAARCAGLRRDALECYNEADEQFKELVTFEDFASSLDTAIAVRGEESPSITITLTPIFYEGEDEARDDDSSKNMCSSNDSKGICKGNLDNNNSSSTNNKSTNTNSSKGNTPSSNGYNGFRCLCTTLSGSSFSVDLQKSNCKGPPAERAELTLKDLARAVVDTLPNWTAACSEAPSSVFLVFTDREGEGTSVSPWNWKQPLADFVQM